MLIAVRKKVFYIMNIQSVLILTMFTVTLANSCNVRKVGDGFICVCNSSHCDSVPELGSLQDRSFKVYSTSKFKPGFNTENGDFSTKKDSSAIVITINKKKHQQIFGFGGAFTDATGINIRSLPEGTQRKLLESYFGPYGIEYSLCRVPIGGVDFSPRPYTYDDHPNDINLEHFQLQPEDLLDKIPFIKEARALRPNLKLFASAWTAPLWMKTGDHFSGYGQLKEKFYQLWANYTIKFFDEYKKHDIDFWGMTTGNEPLDGFFSHSYSLINAMGWAPTRQNKWIKENLGPSLRASAHKDIKIMIHDDDRLTIPYAVPLMLEDIETLEYIDGVAVHWYRDDQVPPEALSFVKSDKKDVFLLSSESCIFQEGVTLGNWDNAAKYIGSILEYLDYGAVGWIDWNMALNLTGGPTYINYLADSPIIVNATAQEFYKQPMFYAMGHFSKFVIPGSFRLDVSYNQREQDNLTSLAFLRPDNLIALVVFNNGSIDASIQIENDNYYSSTVNVEAKSIFTILFPNESDRKI